MDEATQISGLIDIYAKQQLMLPRSVESVIEDIRNFLVAVENEKVIGCCMISFFTTEFAEIRSVAVLQKYRNQGIGKKLISEAEEILHEEKIQYAFVLTLNEPFFKNLGYQRIDKSRFPQKIWRDCMNCPKIMACDEIAMEKKL